MLYRKFVALANEPEHMTVNCSSMRSDFVLADKYSLRGHGRDPINLGSAIRSGETRESGGIPDIGKVTHTGLSSHFNPLPMITWCPFR